MRRHRRTMVGGLLAAAALVASAAVPGRAAADAAPMSWWGYWVGAKGEQPAGLKYVKRRLSRRFGTNVVLIHVDRELDDLPKLRDALVQAQDQGMGVILMIDNLLRKFRVPNPDGTQGPCPVYTAEDVAAWELRMAALATGLGVSPGPDPSDAIVAIVGFDEVNIQASFGCWATEPGVPSPITESLRLAALYFPDVAERGHVWKLGTGAGGSTVAVSANTLAGSTLVFGYHYASFLGPFGPTEVPFCPQRHIFPSGTLPEGSKAKLDVDRLETFIEQVNAVRGTTDTPVVFIPYSNRPGQKPTREQSLGTACNLSTVWAHLRCLASSEPTSWVGQVRGLLAWQWARRKEVKDPATGAVIDAGWVGTERNGALKSAGKWIGRDRLTDACDQAP